MLRVKLLSGETLASIPVAEVDDVKALKQRLHRQHGLPPRFRQRLVHEGKSLDNTVKLDSFTESQLLAATSAEVSEKEHRLLAGAAEDGSVGEDALQRRSDTGDDLQQPSKQRRLHGLKAANVSVKPDVDVMDLQVLIVSFVEVSLDQQRELLDAVVNGRIAEVEALLQRPMDPDSELISTPLTCASRYGQVDVAKLLLEAGADKDLRSGGGGTALMAAAENSHGRVVQLLLDAGSQTNVQNNDGYTALMFAAQNGHDDVVQLLLDARVELDWEDDDGRTAIRMAEEEGRHKIFHLLLYAGAST